MAEAKGGEAAAGVQDKEAADDPENTRRPSNISKRSDDTIWEEAEGAQEDDMIETTVGESKQQTLFAKMEHFVKQRFGERGSPSRPSVTPAQVAEHRSLEDFWVVVDGKVLDLGPFLRGEANHPGGKSILSRQLEKGGQDADERFVRWHHPSGNTVRRVPDYFVGDLVGSLPSKGRCCTIS